MLNSKCLRSSRGPVWVAAYCFKQLKKAQVFETDISSSVDKILQDEMDVISYRVLAYLLLGVVRIYSKKVEYLFHDCNEVLIKINKFVINTKDNAHVETLRMSVTIPDRFELDAFDLDILEDVSGGHIASQEEITLKDVLCKTEGFGQFSLDKFEEFDFCQNTYPADHLMVEDVRQSHLVDMEFEVFPPNSPINLLAGKDMFRNSIFSQKESMNFDTVVVVEGVEKDSVNLFSQDQQIDEDQTVQQTVSYEDEIHEKNRISQEESVDISMFSGREKEPVLSVEACNESHQVDEEQIMAKETSSSSYQMHQEIREVHEATNFQESKERPRDDKSYRKECMDHGESSVANENLEEFIEGSFEEHDNEGNLSYLLKSMFSGRGKEPVLSVEACNESHQVDEEQIMAKETSSSSCQMHQEIREVHEARNFQESKERPQDDKSYRKECMDHGKSSVAKENLEEFIERSFEEHDNEGKLEFQEKVSLEDGKLSVIPPESKNLDATPQSKFRGGSVGRPKSGATTPEFILISTPAVRERARFSRKRKIVLDAMIILPNEVLRKSIQDASNLISNRRKFCRTLLAVQRQSRISSLPNGFYESLLPCSSLELRYLFSKKKMKISDSLEILETPGKLDVSEFQTVGSPEHIATAPQTPPQCSTIKVRSIEHPERTEIQNSDNLGPLNPHESIETQQSLNRDEELNLMEEYNVGTLNSYESLEREQCLTKDEDLNLMNEEINSCETENSELLAGWSERTRKVARHLHRRFLDLRKQRGEEVVNFSQVLGGRVRKECARLFYEILVLRTTSYVDVKQKNAHGDIAIWKLPKLDQTFATEGL